MSRLRRIFPEFGAAAMVVLGAVAIAVIFAAGYSGIVAWIVAGAAIAGGLIIGLLALASQGRATSPDGEAPPFEGDTGPVHDGVHRVLAVVDDSCGEDDVAALLLGETAPETVAYVVAPALSSRLDRWTGDDQAYAAAQERLDTTLAALARHGVRATGHVGSHDPLQAADDGLREFAPDEIVFVVGAGEDGDRLQQGVVELAAQRYPVPVRRLQPAARAR